MADYTVTFADIQTGLVQGSLPVESFAYETVLSAAGSAKITIPLQSEQTRTYAYGSEEVSYTTPGLSLDTLAAGKTSIVIERDNVCVWSGIFWTMSMDVASNTAELGCEGWHSYWSHRILREDKLYSSLVHDQTAIAADLIDWAQEQTYGDIGIDTSGVTSTGYGRDRTYLAHERNTIGKLIDELCQVENGFDWSYRCEKSGLGYVVSFLTSFPKTGRVTDIIFEMGSNVELLKATVDATTMANRVDVTGSGEANGILASLQDNEESLASYPLLETEKSYVDVKQSETLRQYGVRRLATGGSPIIIPTIEVNPDGDPAFGSYQVGDQVRVKGSYGLFEVNEQYRITTIGVTVDSNGKETISVNLASVDLYL